MHLFSRLFYHLKIIIVCFFCCFPGIVYSMANTPCSASTNDCKNVPGQLCYISGTLSCATLCSNSSTSCDPSGETSNVTWIYTNNEYCYNNPPCALGNVACQCSCSGSGCSGSQPPPPPQACTQDLCVTGGYHCATS